MANPPKILILHLHPGQGQEVIACDTREASLRDHPEYETLSYVVGNTSLSHNIYCNGESRGVTQSLGTVLRRLRYKDRVRTLWVDQVCIDQNDPVKKSQQVSTMNDIYKSGSKGLIWLGEIPHEDEAGFCERDVAKAFEVLRAIDPIALPKKSNAGLVYGQIIKKYEQMTAKIDLEPYEMREKYKDTILALMGSSLARFQGVKWWQRIWTVQEVILSPQSTVMWGSQSILFDTLKRIANMMTQDEIYYINFADLFRLNNELGYEFCTPITNLQIKDQQSILGPLYRWRVRSSTDPRDKVYALMGLLPRSAFPSVPYADYSLSVQQLFIHITFDLINMSKGLLPLVGRRGEQHVTPGLPSWTVDWAFHSDSSERTMDYSSHAYRYVWFNADRGDFIPPSFVNNRGLQLQGFLVGRVALVGAVTRVTRKSYIDNNVNYLSTRKTLGQWTELFKNWLAQAPSDTQYIGGGTKRAAFWRTLGGDLAIDEQHQPVRRLEDQDHRSYISIRRGKIGNKELGESIRNMTHNQAFFITENGYIGIGPPTIRAKDEVWVLLCSKVPHLLRRKRPQLLGWMLPDILEQEPGFEYLGDGYVHGIMQGEVVRDAKCKPEKVVIY